MRQLPEQCESRERRIATRETCVLSTGVGGADSDHPPSRSDLDEALRFGDVEIEGDRSAVERLTDLFQLPEPAFRP